MSRLSSEISGALGRLGFAVGGAVALGLALTVILTLVDRALSPGNPDAGQRGVLGIWIGLPVGFIVGWFIAPRRLARRMFLASSLGAFIGSVVGGYAAGLIALIGRRSQTATTDAELNLGEGGVVVNLLFTVIGLAVGWSLARRWSKLRNPDKDRTPTITA